MSDVLDKIKRPIGAEDADRPRLAKRASLPLAVGAEMSIRTHRTKHGMVDTPEYSAWKQMKRRCLSPSHPRYSDWGGRGITVATEWVSDFAAFYAYLGPRPSADHSLDRIDNDGNYEPGNVRWATREQQRSNRRCTNATHCRHGHEWTEANTHIRKRGSRACRRCAADRAYRRNHPSTI